MAFDGIYTACITAELSSCIVGARIDKVYQPKNDILVLHLQGKQRLCISASGGHAGIYITQEEYDNPVNPSGFCMLMRKHLQGGRITDVVQRDTERLVELRVETADEMGYAVSALLIAEVMGKHSNISLVDAADMRIIDCIRRISIDVSRARQLLPGKTYEYPPGQGKTPLDQVNETVIQKILEEGARGKAVMNNIQGLSPALAETIAAGALKNHSESAAMKEKGEKESDRSSCPEACIVRPAYEPVSDKIIYEEIENLRLAIKESDFRPRVYLDEKGIPKDFHCFDLDGYEGVLKRIDFDTPSQACEYYYVNKVTGSRTAQIGDDLHKAVAQKLKKQYLKRQRLAEDVERAQHSDHLRLYGELLTANLHLVKPGDKSVKVLNYYDNQEIEIPLDVKLSPSKNAQSYYKRYGKARTAVREKALQIEENDRIIEYLESVLVFVDNASTADELAVVREELVEGGYLRRRKNTKPI